MWEEIYLSINNDALIIFILQILSNTNHEKPLLFLCISKYPIYRIALNVIKFYFQYFITTAVQ
ncbi:hypothetical protein B5G37_10585 [Pseudoflavonifractor sp. An85]|nr:hypothetical protein B5G37_10585 [Pseudoflavonifractor sp. An85]